MKSPLHAVLALLFVATAVPAAAQRYPTATVRIIVGFGPGSTADIVARLVAKHFEQEFGQPAVVENRPGNSSMLAAEAVARAPTTATRCSWRRSPTRSTRRRPMSVQSREADLAPVALLGVVPNVLVAHPFGAGRRSCKELIALAQAEAGQPDLRNVGRRDGEPSRGRIVQQQGRHQDRRRALSGRQQPGAARPARRPHHADVQRGGDARAACRCRTS